MVYFLLTLVMLILTPAAGWACASCGCTLSSDWETSASTGFKLDLRYDYIDQNQLRSGTSTISRTNASHLTNGNGNEEIEAYTKNNYLTATAEYAIDSDWRIGLVLPYITRNHSTLGTASNGATPGLGGGQYTSNTSSLGDVKLLSRYQGFSPEHDLGVLFGIKLPTGSHNLTGTSSDPAQPAPAPIDRGLQPGSGTTDFLIGAYYLLPLNKNWDYFTDYVVQIALNSVDQYRPGDGLNLNIGFRYMGFELFRPQIQVNGRYIHADGGVHADAYNTGGTLLYLSPGVTVPIAAVIDMYAFVQLPLYQNLLGVQLAPTYTASLGARYNF